MRVPIALGIGAVLVMTVFFVLAGWEFLLEDRLFGDAEGEVIEYSTQRWKEVLTVTGISVLVLLFPMWLVHKNAVAHHRTGAALSEAEQRMQAILDNAPESVFLKDTKGRYVLVNRSFERRLGVRAEDILGKTLHDIYPKDLADLYLEQERQVLESGETITRELPAKWPDGSARTYLSVKFPVRSTEGEITHVGTITTDITDAKAAESELREQQARMQAILEHSPASIFMKDRDGRFVLANKIFAERLGTDIEGVVGKSTGDFYPEDLAEFYISQDKLVLETGESVVGEFPTIWSDGSGHLNLTVKFPVLDDSGEIMHVGTFTTDITEMRAAERKLRESEELLHAIIDNSPLTIYVKDLEGRYEILNRKFEEHIGEPIDKIIGKTSRDFFPEELSDLYIDHEREVIESGETIIRENKGTSREPPHDRQLLVVKFPIRDPNGEIKHVGTFTTDITEFKAVEIALKESEARYRTLSEFASEAVFINDGTYIVDANSAAERMFGYSREEFIGKRIADVNAPEVREMVADIISRQSEETYEGIALRKDGTTFEAEYQPRIIDYHGKPHRFVALRDISARKAMDRMKDELISIVSHELRTPLTSIRGSLGLAAGGVLGDIPEKARAMINLALKNTERLTILVNRILDIEKATAGTLELELARMDLGDLVKDVVEANAGLAEEFKVTFELGEKVAAPVVVDGERISQVVANLLSNAAKFSPAGGTVRISVGAADGLARVRVADEGPGIPMEFQERLFDKFAQADSSDTRRTAGSGLGLYISKAIIEKHGGRIGFDTVSESGTTFYFTLPLSGGENGNEEKSA